MTTTDQKQRTRIRPSSRDPITHWLDVFTKLLAVPPAERLRIRDELEDHLRMRVDDLLILGMTEPEAVQKAVTELGETAELAKRFKEARTNPRRRILMHTALFTVAGLALTFSIVGMNPPTNHSMNPAQSQGIVEVQPEGADISKHPRLEFDLDAGPLDEVLAQLAEFAGARLFVHWGSLEAVGLDSESDVAAIPSKGLEMNKVRQLLNSALGLEGLDQITDSFEDGLMEIGTQRYFDMQSMITLDHDVSELVPADHILEYTNEAVTLRDSIITVVEPAIWEGDEPIGAIATIGTQLSVRAPERIQKQITDYIERLQHAQAQQEQAKEAELQRSNEARLRQREQALDQQKKNRAKYSDDNEKLKNMLVELSLGYWESEYSIRDFEKKYHEATDDERDQIRSGIVKARARLEAIEVDRKMIKEEIHLTQIYFRQSGGVMIPADSD